MAKHFLTPLNSVFEPFCNPGTTTIALVDTVSTDSDEVIFSNDVRWCPEINARHDFSLLLEGHKVHLPTFKTHSARDVDFSPDCRIFCIC